jgi:DNA-binding beta-propeller fold protein YncE
VSYPDNYSLTAAWYVYMAQSLNATSSSPTFIQGKATTVIHYGSVCAGGVSCTGNRDLYDDFGVAVNPNTGKAVIVYSDDQYINNSKIRLPYNAPLLTERPPSMMKVAPVM